MSARKREPRIGRPPLREGSAHTSVFSLKLSSEERSAIEAAADRAGKPVSQWAREAMLSVAKG